ncbi:Protein phosphatase, putative [Hondaea fermentalgiana]|uniref:Protein phosphatase, putative n=1 Tax=Hondaea fermentalgiana TaxID=2315210 RepID=A0A2R5G4L7_9STRA|nr:Protein phosphatase, putative [Hondaea fermentalgiana]|eukprot:GBG25966.1 Protein phosphatase, putative [Hondaea fermentalgiana]
MGAYLDKPVTTKESFDGLYVNIEGDAEHAFAVSEMQGWRKTMEDAHITKHGIAEVDGEPVSVFGVFDGHGGKEVAAFCAQHLTEELVELESFRKGDFERALPEVFHQMDNMLRSEAYASELSKLRDQDDAVSSSAENHASDQDDEDEANDEGASGASAKDPPSRESIQADVKEKMDAAEQKGSLTKAEALELVMKMMKLKSMDEEQASEGNAAQDGAAVGARYTDAGCTAVVCLLHGPRIFVANAGDSRAILSTNGTARALSQDHKPSQDRELKRIRAAGGFVNEAGRVNGNLNLSRSIGDLKYKVNEDLDPADQIITAEPDVRVFELTDEDEFFFIACDGVYDVMTNQRAVDFVFERLAKGVQPVSTILEEVFEECICDSPQAAQGLGADNMTACLVLLKPLSYFPAHAASHQKKSATGSRSKSSRLFRTKSRHKT